MPVEEGGRMTDDRNLTHFLIERLREVEDRLYTLEDEMERMNRDQLSLIFLCTVATTLCMTLSIVTLVI